MAENPARAVMRALLLTIALLPGLSCARADELAWIQLTQEQRTVLAPFERDWAGFPTGRRKVLADLAQRYPAGSSGYERIRENIRHWVALDAREREQALTGFSKFKALSPEEQQTVVNLWQQYQKLPESTKQRLREQARKN